MPNPLYDLYSFSDYKTLLKARLHFLRKKKASLSWRNIAEKIPMQATYLSKALNDKKTHLSEDDLFRICRWLDLKIGEIEFVLLLRSENMTNEKDRKEFLIQRIQDLKKKRVLSTDYTSAEIQELTNEMSYLLDPISVLVHVALFVPKYKKDPLLLCSQLGIAQAKLKKSLEILSKCDYVQLGKLPFSVTSVNTKSPHFGREHPFTRTHQAAIKSSLLFRLTQTSEEKKESFVATFTMDDKGFDASRKAFEDFIKKIHAISSASKDEKLFQLNFDLLEWF